MEDSFENLDHVVRYWAKEKVKKGLVEELNKYEKQEVQRKTTFFWKMTRKKILEQSQSAVERD